MYSTVLSFSEEYAGGQVYRGLILTPSHLSVINSVHVGFKENSNLWSWIWAGRVQINMIVLTDSRNNERYCHLMSLPSLC